MPVSFLNAERISTRIFFYFYCLPGHMKKNEHHILCNIFAQYFLPKAYRLKKSIDGRKTE